MVQRTARCSTEMLAPVAWKLIILDAQYRFKPCVTWMTRSYYSTRGKQVFSLLELEISWFVLENEKMAILILKSVSLPLY